MVVLKILIPILIAIVIIGVSFYFLNRKLTKMQTSQQALLNQHRQTVSLFIIDAKKTKIKEGTFPKNILSQFPKYMRWKKMPLVQARVNNKNMTFICDEKIFKLIPVGKTVKADIAGLYIIDIKPGKR